MARKRRGRPVHGWVAVDKPVGPTSTQVVGRVRRVFGAQKVGHGGTLDPMASGLLPIALGEATKTVSYVMDAEKTYRFTVRWGQATDSDDAEGAVTAESPHRPDEAAIRAVLPDFTGRLSQVPPAYSAIKVAGRRAYDLARAQADFALEAREITITGLALLECPDADHAVFEASCGKGAYMRALARDLGEALGTRGHIAALRRIRVGPFEENNAISLETLESLGHSAAAFEHLLPVGAALDDIPALTLTAGEANRLRCGQAVSLLARADRERTQHLSHGAVVCAMAADTPVALARYEAGEIRPIRVLNL
jgi:tRNA pseudouridine55 synthase